MAKRSRRPPENKPSLLVAAEITRLRRFARAASPRAATRAPPQFPFAEVSPARHGGRFLAMSDIPQDITHDQHAVRRQKLADLRAGGFDPFRANVATTHFSGDAKALYVDGQDYTVTVTVAGRLVTFRVQGGS